MLTDVTTCIRCGKLRIVTKNWSESLNGTKTAYTQEVCPDADCQKIVERELKKKDERVKELQKQSLERRNLLRHKKPVKTPPLKKKN